MNVLVPIDIHSRPVGLLKYALDFSQAYNANLTFLHIISGNLNVGKALDYKPFQDAVERIQNSFSTWLTKEENKDLSIQLQKSNFSLEVRFAIPGFGIVEYSIRNKIDMILMATRDKHGLADKILGSTSSIVVKNSACPVLLVLSKSKFQKFRNTIFTVDEKGIVKSALRNLKYLNTAFKSNIEYLHIGQSVSLIKNNIKYRHLDILNKAKPIIHSIPTKVTSPKHLGSLIDSFCNKNQTDLLIISHRKTPWFQTIFTSFHSTNSTYEINTPVLVIQEKNDYYKGKIEIAEYQYLN